MNISNHVKFNHYNQKLGIRKENMFYRFFIDIFIRQNDGKFIIKSVTDFL